MQEKIDALREVLAFAFETSVLMGQSQETAISKKLASWAAILAVPTAVAGIYGMNFRDIPETRDGLGVGYTVVCRSCWRRAGCSTGGSGRATGSELPRRSSQGGARTKTGIGIRERRYRRSLVLTPDGVSARTVAGSLAATVQPPDFGRRQNPAAAAAAGGRTR